MRYDNDEFMNDDETMNKLDNETDRVLKSNTGKVEIKNNLT